MREMLQFYVDCEWVNPVSPQSFDVINPATEDVCGRISLGSPEDADKAVAAAKKALPAFSQTSVEERIALLEETLETKSVYGYREAG
ncbi:MAG: aldehyde dehydrogenase family protein [Pseudomonadota bacterium]|nr:aldehyde dehydrogenase family protein [Pseudomonadota bacterium]